MKFAASIDVMPRAEISDPQGQTVERAMPQLGFEAISAVRVGKRITCTIEAPDEAAARATLAAACEKVLANPVIEDYGLELAPIE
ncbi:MAG: phosphoribosylformylglycinamidine synthase subunit PurS [Actinomycetota bacterium]